MLRLKAFEVAQRILTGIELMHMLRKGRMDAGVGHGLTAVKQFSPWPPNPSLGK